MLWKTASVRPGLGGMSVPDPFVLTTVVVIHGLRSKNLWFKLLSEDPNREIRLSLSAILRNHLAGCCNILQRSFESCAGQFADCRVCW